MIELIENQHEDIVAFRMDGTASEADLKPLLVCMNEKLQHYGSLKLLIEYVDAGGFSMDTLVEDFSHQFGNWSSCRKVAIVTFREWLSQAHQLSHQLDETRLKSFSYADQHEAKQWITQ
jgi:hypothetical protein